MQERLQKCYEKSPTEPVEGGDIDPALLLRTLQVCLFGSFDHRNETKKFAALPKSYAPLSSSDLKYWDANACPYCADVF